MNRVKKQAPVKLYLTVIPLLFLSLALGAFGLRNYVAGALSQDYETGLRDELLTVEQALEHAFIADDFHSVEQLITNVSYRGQIYAIRILDRNSNILASSVPAESGIQLDRQSTQCRPCHYDNNFEALSIKQLPAQDKGQPVMVTAKAIENQIACQSCHPNTGENLGVILAEHNSTQVEARKSDFTLGIYSGAGALFLLLAGVFWIGVQRFVGRPLDSLVTRESDPALSNRPDEFGALARRLQALETGVQESNLQLDIQRRNINTVLTLTESIDVTLTPEKVLQFSIDKVKEVTGFIAVAMRLFDPQRKCFCLVAQSGMTSQMVDDLACIPADIGFTGDVFKTHHAAYTSDINADPRLESPAPLEAGFRSLVSVPFLSGERLMGSMELASKEAHQWTESEIRWLELMGRSIGSVLHHIETSHQLQGMAVMQERTRLAQEIHDGLAQLIGTIRLWAEEAQLALQENDLREVQDDLQKIESNARDAYGSLREEVLGLRDTISPGRGVIPVIRGFLNRFQRQWGIKTEFVLEHSQPDGLNESWISPAAEIQLLRMIQEGLTNVRRHASASAVTVTIDGNEERLRVQIRDDGQGFDPQNVPEEKLGLRIMRERANSVGGRVTVDSGKGQGTCLIVELPKQTQPPNSASSRLGIER